jgi:hypothetical protein
MMRENRRVIAKERRELLAMSVFDDFRRSPGRFGLRIVGSVASDDAVRDNSDLDLQVIGDRVVIPDRLQSVFTELPTGVSWLYERGRIDVIAVKAMLEDVAVSIQFLNRYALSKLARPQRRFLRVYRTTATNSTADFRGFSDEVIMDMPQTSYGSGFMLLVPDGAMLGGAFRLNLYQRMVLAGRDVRSIPEFAACQKVLASRVRDVGRSLCSFRDPARLVQIFGPRAARWNDRFADQVAELIQ